MFSDIITSIKANLYERIVSPFSGAFLIAFILANFELVLLVFSDKSFGYKVRYIHDILYVNPLDCALHFLVYPLFSAFIFIVIYPYPSRWAYKYWQTQQSKLKAIKLEIEGDKPLSVDEARELRRQVVILENRYDEEIESRDKQIQELKRIISDYESSRLEAEPRNDKELDEDDELDDFSDLEANDQPKIFSEETYRKLKEYDYNFGEEELLVLHYIALQHRGVRLENLANYIHFSNVRTEFIIKHLEQSDFVKYFEDTSTVSLTDTGKAFVVKFDLDKE